MYNFTSFYNEVLTMGDDNFKAAAHRFLDPIVKKRSTEDAARDAKIKAISDCLVSVGNEPTTIKAVSAYTSLSVPSVSGMATTMQDMGLLIKGEKVVDHKVVRTIWLEPDYYAELTAGNDDVAD